MNKAVKNTVRNGVNICAFFLLLMLTTVCGQSSDTNQRVLPTGELVENHLKGGEKHAYTFNLKAGEFARVDVEQRNVDVLVTLFAPDDSVAAEMDAKDGRLWRETVSCVAEKDGVYRLEIKAYGAPTTTGVYTVKRAETRMSVPNDRKRLSAESHLSAARKFLLQGGKQPEVVREYEASAKIWRELGEANWEGVTLLLLGRLNINMSSNESAIETLNRSIELFQKTNDRFGEGFALINVGNLFTNLSQYDKARKEYEKALIINRETKNRRGEGSTLIGLGNIHYYVNEYAKAETYYRQALKIVVETNDRRTEGILHNSLGTVYYNLKQYDKARDSYTQALAIRKELNDRRGAGFTLNGLGNLHHDLKQNARAIEFYLQALPIRRELNDKIGEGDTLTGLGAAHADLGQYEQALKYYEQALMVRKEIKDLFGEGITASYLLQMWEKLNNPALAIIYGKQSVNAFQEIRRNIKNLETSSQKSFHSDNINVYRRLSNILISEGRLAEAQAVLELLKDEEYKQLTRDDETPVTVPYSQVESNVMAIVENIVTLERRQSDLQAQRQTGKLSKEDEAKLEQLRLDLAAANKSFDDALEAIRRVKAPAARADEVKGGLELQKVLAALGKNTDSGVVALYTVLDVDDKAGANGKVKSKFGWVIMVTENNYKAYPINVTNLAETILQFRAALSSDRYEPKLPAKKIYNAIFRHTSVNRKTTLENDLREYLKSHKNKTLMWSLDGVLRYVPMAALHDGKQYLVENYRNSVFSKNSYSSLKDESKTGWTALGLGVSEERQGFKPLPGVEMELDAIIRETGEQTGILQGSVKLNKNFTKKEFFSIADGGFPVVHIASHFSFSPTGDRNDSFLLAGDGNLTFGEMNASKNLFGNVDLLTLSACDTAMVGNGMEAESLPFLAQKLGAKAVIASLWKVADVATPELMIRFYKLRAENPHLPKAEAFRQAQLSLIRGEGKILLLESFSRRRSEINNEASNRINLPRFVKSAKKPFAHPFYWSPFVLVGNWR